ncbi:hypothetical protein RN001_002710 [Aquatica leii]|uniref:Mutator-like transposase domain-containing protein n=1 Tax=Aquatica leii TaxID=1421715 RepID=A0AAN7Q1Y9_9COLE|nr:hypothetical protein RN001_005911 [Aquatica leii]KAK4886439.1 hypothetical protein RN001_002710 [Aquatica leii]
MRIVKEVTFGLNSSLHFYCDNCEKTCVINSEPHNVGKDINKEIVWGCLSTAMCAAGEEEKRLAIENNQFIEISGNRVPYISVIVDGAWSKRSYGHGYNASSGVVSKYR